MRKTWTLLVLSVLIAGTGLFVSSQDASAAFHIMRVWEIMGGAAGNNQVQYVELRMPIGGQNLIATHEVCFFDDMGVPKVRMEFTANAPNGPSGVHSILLGTSEFDTAWAAGSPDYTFGGAGSTMTSLNGGVVTRPVQAPGGKVGFGDYDANCNDLGNIDSVAYGITGSVTTDYGTKLAADLPITGTQAIKYKDTIPLCHPNQFIVCPRSNNADYTVVDVNTPAGNNPRNNVPQSGPVGITDTDGDGVPDASDNCPTISNPGQANADGDAAGDACDLCPGTAPAAAVDANGCSQAQVDADADGACDPGAPSGGPGPCTGTDNCPTTSNPSQGDVDGDTLGDACDADADDDGYDNGAESGTPLCGNGKNDDDKTGAGLVADDAVIDDGCPGGPAQAGAFSEAQFKIGTNQLGPCSVGADAGQSPSWPSDFVSGGIPDSTDKINVLDLTSYIAPPATRKLDTAPGQANFNSRWDLNPGRGVFNNMINVTDLTALIAGTSGFPPMFGGSTKAFNGPMCTGA